jgi:hypothetical protein
MPIKMDWFASFMFSSMMTCLLSILISHLEHYIIIGWILNNLVYVWYYDKKVSNSSRLYIKLLSSMVECPGCDSKHSFIFEYIHVKICWIIDLRWKTTKVAHLNFKLK